MTDLISEAKCGDAAAQFNLGLRLQDGRDVPRDYAKAALWHLKAARQGHTGAQYSLALMYAKGQGGKNNPSKAASWFRRAAKLGHQAAQFELACLYDRGIGVEHNLVMAYVWYTIASAKRGSMDKRSIETSGGVSSRLTVSTKIGHTVAAAHRARLGVKLSPAERASADVLVRSWIDRLADSDG